MSSCLTALVCSSCTYNPKCTSQILAILTTFLSLTHAAKWRTSGNSNLCAGSHDPDDRDSTTMAGCDASDASPLKQDCRDMLDTIDQAD
ncbi:hypothetical protein NUU61_005526 [Penicillium alfredii]|uniref:Uncharacterized protein n=1 Tax=Penicillium alfredii TaxID=1506179 RepID=A0A9W9F9K6_9EURO|nr:uncharacterized protein NUU61_005526 [Penicillium alfredii]KAJ5096170.1 hypothetical protein NUU61_005526 [Penicillium alfredii]